MRYLILLLALSAAGCRQAGITKIHATAQRDVIVRIAQDAKQTAGQDISTKAKASGSGGLLPK